jgi:hypothetical protein
MSMTATSTTPAQYMRGWLHSCHHSARLKAMPATLQSQDSMPSKQSTQTPFLAHSFPPVVSVDSRAWNPVAAITLTCKLVATEHSWHHPSFCDIRLHWPCIPAFLFLRTNSSAARIPQHISIPPHITTTSKSDRTRSKLWIAFEQAHETNDISIARTYLLSQKQLPQRIRRQRTNESHDACSRITKSQEPKDTPCLRTLATTNYSTSRPERRRTRTPALVRTERRIFNALARFLHSWLHHDFSPYH